MSVIRRMYLISPLFFKEGNQYRQLELNGLFTNREGKKVLLSLNDV